MHKEIKGMLSVVTECWILHQKYDEGSLSTSNLLIKNQNLLPMRKLGNAIMSIKKEFLPKKEVSEAFGEERNDGLKGILNQIYQTFDGNDLYPSIQKKQQLGCILQLKTIHLLLETKKYEYSCFWSF